MSGRREVPEFGLFKDLLKFQSDWRSLRVIFLLFISMVLLVHILVYQHWKESYRFYHLKSLQADVNVVANVKEIVVLTKEQESTPTEEQESTPTKEQESTPTEEQESTQVIYPPEMNATHIYGLLLEPVNAKYTRNIYFTVKTTHKYYTGRLLSSVLSWLQVVDRNKVGII